MNLFRKKDRAELAKTERIFLLSGYQIRLISKPFHFDPICFCNLRRARQSGTGYNDFVMNLNRDIEVREKLFEDVEAVNLGQND